MFFAAASTLPFFKLLYASLALIATNCSTLGPGSNQLNAARAAVADQFRLVELVMVDIGVSQNGTGTNSRVQSR